MPNVGPLELAVVAIIALVVFGPKRLPELGRSMGKGIREFKGSLSGDDGPDDQAAIESAKNGGDPVEDLKEPTDEPGLSMDEDDRQGERVDGEVVTPEGS